jgi:hypothetical protein
MLLDKGVLEALGDCLWEYGGCDFLVKREQVVDSGRSKVDYVIKVDGEDEALVEAKSPSVMKKVGKSLPPNGIELTWARGQPLAPKILAQVSTLSSLPTALAFKKHI